MSLSLLPHHNEVIKVCARAGPRSSSVENNDTLAWAWKLKIKNYHNEVGKGLFRQIDYFCLDKNVEYSCIIHTRDSIDILAHKVLECRFDNASNSIRH